MTTNIIEGLDNHHQGDDVTDTENGSAAKKVVLTAGSAVMSAASSVKDTAVTTAKKVAENERVAAAGTKVKDVANSDTAKKHRSKVFGVAGALVLLLVVRRVRKGRNEA